MAIKIGIVSLKMSFYLIKFDQLCFENKIVLRYARSANTDFLCQPTFLRTNIFMQPNVYLLMRYFCHDETSWSGYQLPPQRLTKWRADLWADRAPGCTGIGSVCFTKGAVFPFH